MPSSSSWRMGWGGGEGGSARTDHLISRSNLLSKRQGRGCDSQQIAALNCASSLVRLLQHMSLILRISHQRLVVLLKWSYCMASYEVRRIEQKTLEFPIITCDDATCLNAAELHLLITHGCTRVSTSITILSIDRRSQTWYARRFNSSFAERPARRQHYGRLRGLSGSILRWRNTSLRRLGPS